MMNGRPSNQIVFALSLVLFVTLLSGCVRRTITITTDPPQARVFLNDQEIGRSEVSTDVLWYGDYDVVIGARSAATQATASSPTSSPTRSDQNP